MPITLPCESIVREIRYEPDTNGTLHILIPPQPTGLHGRNRLFWLIFLLFPLLLVGVTLCYFRDVYTFELATVSGSFIALFGIAFGWLADCKFLARISIDASPTQLTIHRKSGASITSRTFHRDRLRAIDVVRDRHDEFSRDIWLLRVQGPFEWDVLLNHLSRPDSEQLASRLRTILHLPPSPA